MGGLNKEILFERGQWIVIRCQYEGKLWICAEHMIGCTYSDPHDDEEWNLTSAFWSWEHDDDDDPAVCWECKAEVPSDIVGIVGIVKMMNWGVL